MSVMHLTVGRIDYLNLWPLFHSISKEPLSERIHFISGHPAYLNRKLCRREIHLAPSSSIEYLLHAENYLLLPDLSVSAKDNIQSVLLCLPFSWESLGPYIRQGGSVYMTRASDTSRALLQILWHFYWKLPKPEWEQVEPGKGVSTGKPFLEIGDHALEMYLDCPSGWQVVDLGAEWKKMTGLPFVFALWILNRTLPEPQKSFLKELGAQLIKTREKLPSQYLRLCTEYPCKKFRPEDIVNYWQNMDYGLNSNQLASLTIFGRYLAKLGLIPGTPALDFFDIYT